MMNRLYSNHFEVNFIISLLFASCFAANVNAQVIPDVCPPPSSIEGYTYAGTYGNSTYFVSNFYTTANDANAAAEATGGHLATISDAGENAYVAGIAGGLAWIGFTDQAEEGNFEWVNGELVTYTNWCTGEPNEYCCGGEDWTVINWCQNGGWNDLYNSADWMLLIVVEFSNTGDDDCDGVANECDVCPGGNDNGPCSATSLPPLNTLPPYWICSNNNNSEKVKICHNGNTLCVSVNAVQAHLDHGDFLGPCSSCAQNISAPSGNSHNNFAQSLEMELAPNPASTSLNIRLHGLPEGEAELVVYDQLGKVALLQNLEDGTSQLSLDLPSDKFSAGLYFVRITSGQATLTERLVISRK